MFGEPNPEASGWQDDSTAAADTAVTITKAARAGHHWVVDAIQWSYDGTPVGGRVTVKSASTVIYDVDVTTDGNGGETFNPVSPLQCTVGEALEIRLYAGGGTVIGKLNAQGR